MGVQILLRGKLYHRNFWGEGPTWESQTGVRESQGEAVTSLEVGSHSR